MATQVISKVESVVSRWNDHFLEQPKDSAVPGSDDLFIVNPNLRELEIRSDGIRR